MVASYQLLVYDGGVKNQKLADDARAVQAAWAGASARLKAAAANRRAFVARAVAAGEDPGEIGKEMGVRPSTMAAILLSISKHNTRSAP